ncbi:prephenate dehydratase [Paenibacillus chartarius]|uniref:Prephenate dehydratase n=1 Tax=Paenibacillus chartarius TaxID=747481 RepID=A0ABV6DIV2_9BACL
MKRIATLGPATFSEESVQYYFGTEQYEYLPFKGIDEVFGATVNGTADYGVIPIENTLEGSVRNHLDTIVHEVDLPIQAEWLYPIRMNLLGLTASSAEESGAGGDPDRPYAGIRKVLTHHAAPAQCSVFLKTHLPHAQVDIVSSTAEGARLVREYGDPSIAAISPLAPAKLYGLNVLAPDIQDHDANVTRFIMIGREPIALTNREGLPKTTILVQLAEDFPGALHQVLAAFAWRRINLTRIESRPTRKKLGSYYFYIEVEGSLDSVLIPAALEEIRAIGCQVRLLGSYSSYTFEASTVRSKA